MLPDALMISGAALLSYAAWLLHPAAGYATAGVLTLTAGILTARSKK